MCGGGDERHEFGHALVLVVELGVESLLGKGELGLLEAVTELVLDRLLLFKEGCLEAVVGDGRPAVETINLASQSCHRPTIDHYKYLVQRDNERCLSVTEQSDGFESLRLKTVHNIHHQNGNITE